MNSTGKPLTASELAGLRMPPWIIWAALALVWIAGTGLYPLYEPDEGRYAEIPREMAVTGDWLTPRLDGLKYFEKPPLQYWATAAAYTVFEVNEWTTRAWPLLLSFLCLGLTFAWVGRLFGSQAALASLAVLGTSPLFIVIGHLNVLDGAFTFWLTATMLAFTLGQVAPDGSRGERSWMLLAWLAAAFAVLSKGIVAPALAGLSLVVYSIGHRDLRVWRRLHVLLGLPLFLLIAAPWFIAVSLRNPEFAKFFFLHEHFARFLTTGANRVEPWWYFLAVGALALLPWLPDLPRAIRHAWRNSAATAAFRPLRFMLVYSAVTLAFFSISQSKLPPYILPMMPALAAVIGVSLGGRSPVLTRVAWIAATLMGLGSVGLVISSARHYHGVQAWVLTWAVAAGAIAILMVLGVRRAHSDARNILVLVVGSMLAWQCLMVGNAPSRSSRDLVERIRGEVGEHSLIYSVGQYRQSVPPYLGRTLTLVDYTGELEFGLNQEPGRNAVSFEEFGRRWRASSDAIALFNPSDWERFSRQGLPGRLIASDRESVVVRR